MRLTACLEIYDYLKNSLQKRTIAVPRHRREDNITTDLRVMGTKILTGLN